MQVIFSVHAIHTGQGAISHSAVEGDPQTIASVLAYGPPEKWQDSLSKTEMDVPVWQGQDINPTSKNVFL